MLSSSWVSCCNIYPSRQSSSITRVTTRRASLVLMSSYPQVSDFLGHLPIALLESYRFRYRSIGATGNRGAYPSCILLVRYCLFFLIMRRTLGPLSKYNKQRKSRLGRISASIFPSGQSGHLDLNFRRRPSFTCQSCLLRHMRSMTTANRALLGAHTNNIIIATSKTIGGILRRTARTAKHRRSGYLDLQVTLHGTTPISGGTLEL